MKLLVGALLLCFLQVGYSLHFIVQPFTLFGFCDIGSIIFGIFLVSLSIVLQPSNFIDRWGRQLFKHHTDSSLKSLFIGLFQFLVLQLVGWHFVTRTVSISQGLTFDKDFIIDGATIVQTAGTIASLIFAAFQTVTASAENQYEVKGRLRFDQNDELYFYLRLTLSAGMGAFIGQMKALQLSCLFLNGNYCLQYCL